MNSGGLRIPSNEEPRDAQKCRAAWKERQRHWGGDRGQPCAVRSIRVVELATRMERTKALNPVGLEAVKGVLVRRARPFGHPWSTR